ncbi:MAG: tetratricopeptide repeat protein [Candidatus Aminicenantaceae bacterium]
MNKQRSFLYCIFLFLTLSLFISCASSYYESQLQFGVKAAQKNLWDEALFRWKKIIESNPDSAAAHNNLAVAYEVKRQWEKAKCEYEIALKLDPDNELIKSNFESLIKLIETDKNEKNKDKN